MILKIASLTFCSILGTVPAFAATIWTNTITGTNPNTANPYTAGQTVVADLTVLGIGRSAGITGQSGNNQYNAAGWTTAAGIDLGDYFTFTLDAAAGFEIDFNSFVYTSARSSQGPASFSVRSSVDGFTANLALPAATGASISLAAAVFQNITNAIEFRIYGFGAGNTNGSFAINDFTFDGTVTAVPEPNSAAMVAGAIGCLGLIRRRRR